MHFPRRCFHPSIPFLKNSSDWFLSHVFVACFASSGLLKRTPFKCSLSFGNRKKSDGATCGSNFHRNSLKISFVFLAECAGALSLWKRIPRWSFPGRFLANSVHNFLKTFYMALKKAVWAISFSWRSHQWRYSVKREDLEWISLLCE